MAPSKSDDEDGDSELEEDLKGVEGFVEDNAENVAIVAETAVAAVVEVPVAFMKDFSLLTMLVAIGVVWVLVWFSCVAFASWVLHATGILNSFLMAFLEYFKIIVTAWDAIFVALFYVVKFVACEFPLISMAIGPNNRGICSKSPHLNTHLIDVDPDWWKTRGWEMMYELETTCGGCLFFPCVVQCEGTD